MKRFYTPSIACSALVAFGLMATPVQADACLADCAPPGGDGVINVLDLIEVLLEWGQVGTPCDFLPPAGVGNPELDAVQEGFGQTCGACCLAGGTCLTSTQAECTNAGGAAWVSGENCTDSDGDRIPDAFELANCSAFDGCFVGTSPDEADTDGDGIRDGDEVYPPHFGPDFPALGANPLRKDKFVEIDWTEDNLHEHRPSAGLLDPIVDAFANAPNINPGPALPACKVESGIALHFDYGQDVGTGGPYTGGNLLGDDLCVVFSGGADEFSDYKSKNFDSNRHLYFHYCISTHFSYPAEDPENPGDCLVLASRSRGELYGDDFTLVRSYPLPSSSSRVIMHELGHNLALHHGGFFDARNYKPNYNSIMNYRYFSAIDTDCDGCRDGGMDYSRGGNLTLDENSLLEGAGLCPGGPPVDWNRNGIIDHVSVSRNINCAIHTPPNVVCPPDSGGGLPTQDCVTLYDPGLTECCGATQSNCYDTVCTVLLAHDDWGELLLPINPSTDLKPGEIITCDLP